MSAGTLITPESSVSTTWDVARIRADFPVLPHVTPYSIKTMFLVLGTSFVFDCPKTFSEIIINANVIKFFMFFGLNGFVLFLNCLYVGFHFFFFVFPNRYSVTNRRHIV